MNENLLYVFLLRQMLRVQEWQDYWHWPLQPEVKQSTTPLDPVLTMQLLSWSGSAASEKTNKAEKKPARHQRKRPVSLLANSSGPIASQLLHRCLTLCCVLGSCLYDRGHSSGGGQAGHSVGAGEVGMEWSSGGQLWYEQFLFKIDRES